MSDRKRSRSSTSQKVARRIGEPNEDDEPGRRQDTTSSSSPSTRHLPERHVPALTTYCARAFTTHFRKLAQRESTWPATRAWLDRLPDAVAPNLFSMLADKHPTVLTHGLISQHFLRGSTIRLSHDLPGVTKHTLAAIGASVIDAAYIRHLHVTGFDKFTDDQLAFVVSKLPGLHTLNLRGCSKAAGKTTVAVAERCRDVVTLNLTGTSVSPVMLAPILQNCSNLQVLKLASLSNWTDAAFSKLLVALRSVEDNGEISFPALRTLKLRQTALSDPSVAAIVSACSNLERLDLSFTALHPTLKTALASLTPLPSLQKLVLTSTRVPGPVICDLLEQLPHLRILHLAAMGGGEATAARIGNSSAMTMGDELLWRITDILEDAPDLEVVNLVGNIKLGLTRKQSALAHFFARVGRRCKELQMSGIKNLKSHDLSGLIADVPEDAPPRLQVLGLGNTSIDDTAVPYLAACTMLRNLNLSGTRVTGESLLPLVDACPELTQLDLTGCRGVPVADRRRFFEVWEESKEDQ